VQLVSPELLSLFADIGIVGHNLLDDSAPHVRERMPWRLEMFGYQGVQALADGISMPVEPLPHCEPNLTNILGAMAMGTVNQVDDVGGEARHLISDVE
jgi:hypothetical protein